MAIDPKLIDKLLADYKKPEDIIGEHGLLKQLTKAVLERAMQAEMTEHLAMRSTTRRATTAATRATARRPRP
jgi:putative transposase